MAAGAGAVVAAGLLLLERALVAAVGTPVAQLQALRSLGDGPVDPVAPLLAALALLAEALIGYVLAMLVLRSLSVLPGSVGRLAGRVALAVTPVMLVACSTCSSAGRCWPRRRWRRCRSRPPALGRAPSKSRRPPPGRSAEPSTEQRPGADHR